MPRGSSALLRGAQRRREQLRPLAVVPAPMVAADRVVMGDGAAERHQRVGGGDLDRPALLDQARLVAERVEARNRAPARPG